MAPGKGRGRTREQQCAVLCDKWAALEHVVDGFVKRQAEQVFTSLRGVVSALMEEGAAAYARLGEQDVCMYADYARLMQAYQEIIALYEQHRNRIGAAPVKVILEGVYTVLVSRLKQFEDGCFVVSDHTDAAAANPIRAEKDGIYGKAKAYFSGSLDSQSALFIEQAQASAADSFVAFRRALLDLDEFDTERLLDASDQLCEDIRCFSFMNLYAFYRDSLKFCLSELNDLTRRDATQFFYNLMQDESEVLGSIIKIQVNALEYALRRNTVNTYERQVVNQLLTLLREGHQHFGRAFMDIQTVFDSAQPIPEGEAPVPYQPYESFEAQLLAACDAAKASILRVAQSLHLALEESRRTFYALLDVETDFLFERFRLGFNHSLYRFQRVFSDEGCMANEMRDIFTRLRTDWPAIDSLPEDAATEKEILSGIAETIDIKIDSLNDSIQAFQGDSVRLVSLFAAGKKEVETADRLRAHGDVSARWVLSQCEMAPQTLSAFFEECQGLEVFLPYAAYYEKWEAEHRDKIAKALFSFKKDTLLYEVSTYEEILNYSVTRLREATWEPVTQAVALLDDALASLETILKKNAISVIKPASHDVFNGREHEVLMAEKHDDFKKGEIVKTINSGYRQRDVVILRANVIAAR